MRKLSVQEKKRLLLTPTSRRPFSWNRETARKKHNTVRTARILVVDAMDMPAEVYSYCHSLGICDERRNNIVCVEKDGLPLASWLGQIGYEFGPTEQSWIGIMAR